MMTEFQHLSVPGLCLLMICLIFSLGGAATAASFPSHQHAQNLHQNQHHDPSHRVMESGRILIDADTIKVHGHASKCPCLPGHCDCQHDHCMGYTVLVIPPDLTPLQISRLEDDALYDLVDAHSQWLAMPPDRPPQVLS